MNPLLETAIQAAITAGKEIKELYAVTDFERKSDGSPVTIADMRANEILIDHLSKTGIALLSEESPGISIPYPTQLWIIDPLDGTRDFIEKTDDFVVMIGLLLHGRPTLGVIYAPIQDMLYYAEAGHGAFLVHNGITTRLRVSDREREGLIFIRSIHHSTPEVLDVAEKLHATPYPRGSMGIKAGVLGEGVGDFFFTRGKLGEWDVCAPHILVLEAGGRVTDCSGNPLFYGTPDHRIQNGVVFTNTACHEHLLEVLHT